MRKYGAESLTVTAAQSAANTRLLGGPLRLRGWSTNDGTALGGLTVHQSVTSPGAGQTIASISLPNGLYQVAWSLKLSGTLAAVDSSNVQVFIGATQLATSVNSGNAGLFPQEEIQVSVVNGPLTLAFNANAAGTVGAQYIIDANITPLNDSTAIIFDGGQPVAFIDMDMGGGQTEWLGGDGVAVKTHLSVQTTLGTVQGTLWYDLCYPDDE